jgi:hypothetical protein
MISTPAAAASSAKPQVGSPGVQKPATPPPPELPQVAPPPVAAPAAPAAAPAAPSTNILLIAIFCLLAFLVGGVVVYLLMRH